MPSPPRSPAPPVPALRAAPPPRLAWLRSQGLGLVCGFGTVALLAIGSVVLTATRDGASAGIGMDDLRAFFDPPRLAHLWLYLLFPVAALYAVNTVLATWDTVSRRWRLGIRAPAAYAAAVVHVGFLLALAAHGVGGFLGSDAGAVLVGPGWQELPGFGEARLVSLDVDTLPGGMPREARVRLALRDAEGRETERAVGYNAPLSEGGGATLALLADFGRAWVARISSGADACALAEGQGCRLGGAPVRLVRLVPSPGRGVAAVIAAPGPSGTEETRVVPMGGELPLAGGRLLELASVAPEQVVALRIRRTPGHPWALAAAAVMTLGVALLWRTLLPLRGASGR